MSASGRRDAGPKRTRPWPAPSPQRPWRRAAVVAVLVSGRSRPAGPPSIASAPLSGDGSRPSRFPRTRSLARPVRPAGRSRDRRPGGRPRQAPTGFTRQRTSRPAQYYVKKVKKPQRQMLPFSATVATTQDSWYAGVKGAPSRTVTGQNPKAHLRCSSGDEAKWKQDRARPLWPKRSRRPTTTIWNSTFRSATTTSQSGNCSDKLPTSKDRPGRASCAGCSTRSPPATGGPPSRSSPNTCGSVAQDLLAGPISPGLAPPSTGCLPNSPGSNRWERSLIRWAHRGRPVWATAGNGDWSGESRAQIVDDNTAATARPRVPLERAHRRLTLQVTYEDMGWGEALGERPRS